MPNTYVIIGVLIALLAGAGSFGVYQTKQLGIAEAAIEAKELKIKEKEAAIVQLQVDNAANVEKTLRYQADVRRIEQESDKIQKKAFKDVSRVENILKRKAKIYKRLMNLDYKKSQRELQEITK